MIDGIKCENKFNRFGEKSSILDVMENSHLALMEIINDERLGFKQEIEDLNRKISKDEYEANKDTIDWLIEHYPTDMTDVDVIIGYRADDAYFSYSRDFVQNRLSLQALSEAMRLGKLGTQYVLKSVKAFNSISIVNYENVKQTDDYDIFRKSTLKEFHHIKESDSIDNTFIRDIMRGNR